MPRRLAANELHASFRVMTRRPNIRPCSALVPPRFQISLLGKADVLFDWARDRWCTMREEFSSNSFLAVTVAGLVLLFSGLIVFAFN